MVIKSRQQLRLLNSGKKPKVMEYWKAVLGATEWTLGIFTTHDEAESECLKYNPFFSERKNRIEHYSLRKDGQWNYMGTEYIE